MSFTKVCYESLSRKLKFPEGLVSQARAAGEWQRERDQKFKKRNKVQSLGKQMHSFVHHMMLHYTQFADKPFELYRELVFLFSKLS